MTQDEWSKGWAQRQLKQMDAEAENAGTSGRKLSARDARKRQKLEQLAKYQGAKSPALQLRRLYAEEKEGLQAFSFWDRAR